jgi:signal transduction histidine kinase
MVDDLLLLAEGREGEIRLELTACDLSALASGVVEIWAAAARAAGLELSAELTPSCWVQGDASALERVLSNLLSNAIKFTPAGGRIAVRVAGEVDSIVLDVSDSGIGIDEDLRGRLFNRFERGRQSIERGIGGSGLGLSLVRELVEGHGGTIDAEAAEERGTIFRLRFPRGAAAATTTTAVAPLPKLAPTDFGLVASTPTGEPYARPNMPRATLLLAEDDPLLRDRIARLLSDEYHVLVAADGLEALRLAELHEPDLLVSDIAMPGLDGIELTKRFRARAGNRVAPVLLLTASGEIRDRLQGFDAGAIDYIVKPFEPAELRARVRSQLAMRSIALRLLESEKLVAFGTLTAGLAHEIRNPANGIVNAVDPLREILPPELLVAGSPTAELLDVIEGCSRQIATLSRELLGFRSGAQLDRTPVSIGALLARVRMTAKPRLADIEYRQHLEYTGSLPCVEPLMTQVLSNLLENAAYAAGRGGWVEVRTVVEETTLVIEFGDSGPGIPAALHERVFEPFFTTKPPGVGTGLGLPTAREIVARHGGNLGARERAGRTILRVELPMEVT